LQYLRAHYDENGCEYANCGVVSSLAIEEELGHDDLIQVMLNARMFCQKYEPKKEVDV
jgi:hypothetical protein